MDKKNTIIGSLLIVAAFVCYYISARNAPQNPSPAALRQAVAQQTSAVGTAPAPALSEGPPTAFVAAASDHAGATIIRLENNFIQVRFTDFGGAIRDVALRKYPAALGRPDPFVFNERHSDPMLAFVGLPGLDRGTRFQLVSKTATEVVFRAVLDSRIEVTRRYVLAPNAVGATDPYQLQHETTFRNLTGQALPSMRVALDLGTAAPLNALDYGRYLTTGYSDGGNQRFTTRSSLEESNGIFGLRAHGPIPEIDYAGPVKWATVTSQFFASILTPSEPAAGVVTRRVKLFDRLPDSDRNAYGITTAAQFDLPELAPHGAAKLAGDFYVGPKEYRRLSNADVFKADQEKVMQFGFFKFFSALLLTLMSWIHSCLPGWSWGFAIIFTTLALKLVFFPLTMVSARSARRMQKIQPELKAIKEKHKDNPQKQQAATMELFKKHKVNPMGGCLPMLLTIPFWYGFYTMLQSSAELRFAPFLWAHDLSAPDTVGHIFGFPINIMPVLFTATSFLQMQIMPQPTVDSSQARMMKFMPLIFMFIYYPYSCALSLYSTTNGLFTIGQQLLINRKKDEGDPADATGRAVPAGKSGPGGKPMKNVTPGKRK